MTIDELITALTEVIGPDARKVITQTAVMQLEKDITKTNDILAACYTHVSGTKPKPMLDTLLLLKEKGYMQDDAIPDVEKKGLTMSIAILTKAIELIALLEPLKKEVEQYNVEMTAYKAQLAAEGKTFSDGRSPNKDSGQPASPLAGMEPASTLKH